MSIFDILNTTVKTIADTTAKAQQASQAKTTTSAPAPTTVASTPSNTAPSVASIVVGEKLTQATKNDLSGSIINNPITYSDPEHRVLVNWEDASGKNIIVSIPFSKLNENQSEIISKGGRITKVYEETGSKTIYFQQPTTAEWTAAYKAELVSAYTKSGYIPPDILVQEESQIPSDLKTLFATAPNQKTLYEKIGYEQFLGIDTTKKQSELNQWYTGVMQPKAIVQQDQQKQDFETGFNVLSDIGKTVMNVTGTYLSSFIRYPEALWQDISETLSGKRGEGEVSHLGEQYLGSFDILNPSKPSPQVESWMIQQQQEPNLALRWFNIQVPAYTNVILPLAMGASLRLVSEAIAVADVSTTSGRILLGAKEMATGKFLGVSASKVFQYGTLPLMIGSELGITAAETGITSQQTIGKAGSTILQFGLMGVAYKYTDVAEFERFSSNVRTAYEQGLVSLAPVKGISPEILLAKEPFFGEFNLRGSLSSGYGRFISDVGSREFLGLEPQTSNLTLRGEISGGYAKFITGLAPISGMSPGELLAKEPFFGEFKQSVQIKLNVLANPEAYSQLPFGEKVRTGINRIFNLSMMSPNPNYEGMYTPDYGGLNIRGKLRVGFENFLSDTGSTYYTAKETGLRVKSHGLYPESEINLLEYGTESYYKYPEENPIMPSEIQKSITGAFSFPGDYSKLIVYSVIPGRTTSIALVELSNVKQDAFGKVIGVGKKGNIISGISEAGSQEIEANVTGFSSYKVDDITPSMIDTQWYGIIRSREVKLPGLSGDYSAANFTGSFKMFRYGEVNTTAWGEPVSPDTIWKFSGRLLNESYATEGTTIFRQFDVEEYVPINKYVSEKQLSTYVLSMSRGKVIDTLSEFEDISLTQLPKGKIKPKLSGSGSVLFGTETETIHDIILPGGLSGPEALEGPPRSIEPMYSIKNVIYEETGPDIISSYWSGKVLKTSNLSMQITANLQALSFESILSQINLQQNLSITNQMNLQSQKQLQIQIPQQINIQQQLQLQQQQQVQLQLQQQVQLQQQTQIQQQLQVQLQIPVQVSVNLLIETPIDINVPESPPPNLIIPFIPILPKSKKGKSVDYLNLKVPSTEDWKFRHKGFPVVTSDFFRKVNIKLPKVKI